MSNRVAGEGLHWSTIRDLWLAAKSTEEAHASAVFALESAQAREEKANEARREALIAFARVASCDTCAAGPGVPCYECCCKGLNHPDPGQHKPLRKGNVHQGRLESAQREARVGVE